MLILLAAVSLLVFAVPSRYKFGVAFGVIAAGAVWACAGAFLSFTRSVAALPLNHNLFNLLFGLSLPRIDWLSSLFLVIISIAAVSVTLYGRDYLHLHAARKSAAHFSLHYVALTLMFLSMLGVVIFRGGFAFLFCWELMTITSFVLLLFEGEKREVRRAAVNYLILMHIGFVFLLTGFVVGAEGGLLGFEALRSYFAEHNPVPLFLVFLIGFGMKAGIFPLHIWLPEAHPAAPSHISALMSGVMIKMGVYGVLRVLTYIETELFTIGLILLGVGMVTALWGIILATLQNHLKKLLAYSSIENIGIIFIGVGIALLGCAEGNELLALLGLSGALLHVVNHSFFKPLLFMSAGSVGAFARSLQLDELGGLSKRMPLTTILFLIGSVAICGLPPFNGFISEFLIYLGSLKAVSGGTQVLWCILSVAVLALVGGLAVLAFSKAFGIAFLGNPRSAKAEWAGEATTLMLAAQVLPLAGILLVGWVPVLFTEWIAALVSETFHLPLSAQSADFSPILRSMGGVSLAMLLLLGFVVLIGWLKFRLQKKQGVTEAPTWSCGFTAPNSRLEYTGESFSEGVQNLTNSMTNDRSHQKRGTDGVSKEEVFAAPYQFGIRHNDRVDKLISGRWVYLVRKLNARLALFQTGKINHYVLHALLFLAFIFLLTLIGWI